MSDKNDHWFHTRRFYRSSVKRFFVVVFIARTAYDLLRQMAAQIKSIHTPNSGNRMQANTEVQTYIKQESLALASMARDDSPASSTASSTAPASSTTAECAVKWDRNLKPKLAIMHQCTSVTDRRTDRRTGIMP